MKNINMKGMWIMGLVFLCFIDFQASAQQKLADIPLVDLKTTGGQTVSTKTFSNDGKPVIISFWATWCKPCVKEISAFSENYADWQKETGVKIIAISIDDSRSMSRVAPFINGRGWEIEVYCDPNSDLKRAMNVVNVPHTFLLDGNGKIVFQHTTYADGDEIELYKKVKELVTK